MNIPMAKADWHSKDLKPGELTYERKTKIAYNALLGILDKKITDVNQQIAAYDTLQADFERTNKELIVSILEKGEAQTNRNAVLPFTIASGVLGGLLGGLKGITVGTFKNMDDLSSGDPLQEFMLIPFLPVILPICATLSALEGIGEGAYKSSHAIMDKASPGYNALEEKISANGKKLTALTKEKSNAIDVNAETQKMDFFTSIRETVSQTFPEDLDAKKYIQEALWSEELSGQSYQSFIDTANSQILSHIRNEETAERRREASRRAPLCPRF